MNGMAIFVGVLWSWAPVMLTGFIVGWTLGLRMGWLGRKARSAISNPIVVRRGSTDDAPVSVRVHPNEKWSESDSDSDTLQSIPMPAFFPKQTSVIDFSSLETAQNGAKKC